MRPPPQQPTTSHERTVTMTLTLLCITCTWRAALGQTNNTFDEATETIRFGELAPDAPYSTAGYKADDRGLGPFYGLARSFIDTSLPEELPVDRVEGVVNGDTTILDEWQALAEEFLGFTVCVVIGFLFIIIFPIVAVCFCCCRLFGKCGGKRIQKEREKNSCKRNVFAAIVCVLAIFILTGAACAFATTDQISYNLGGLNASFSHAVDDLITFADSIKAQFTRLGDTNFRYMANVVDQYVKGASKQMSERVITDVNTLVGLEGPLDRLNKLTKTTTTQELDNKVTTLEDQRRSAVKKLSAFDAACNGCIKTPVSAVKLLNLTAMKDSINNFEKKASTDVFGEMKRKISGDIDSAVTAGTKKLDVKAKMDDIFKNQIKGMLDEADDFKEGIRNRSEKYQDKLTDFLDAAKPYDKYRWYVGLFLALFPLVIAVLMLVGMFLGICYGSAYIPPTERSDGSNWGGICLMSAVGLIFICGALLMLLTTAQYMVGSLTERYVCQTIDNLERVEKYTQSLNLSTDLSNISFPINGEEINTSITKLMRGCEEGKTLYTVLGLSGVVDTALKQITDYKKDLDVTKSINMGNAANALNGLNLSAQINDLKDTSKELVSVEDTINSTEGDLEKQKAQAAALDPKFGAPYDPMLATLTEMKRLIKDLKTVADDIVTEANKLPALVSAASAKLQNQTLMTGVIKKAVTDFVNIIFGFVDSYVKDIRTKLENDVAKCTPLYFVIKAVITEDFCHGIVDPLNGFWLALGWCIFFFIPSLIFGVKLAKYYRRMLYSDFYDSTKPDQIIVVPHGTLQFETRGTQFRGTLRKMSRQV